MVEVWLPYGRTEVCVRIPTRNFSAVIQPNEKVGAQNPQAEIESALLNPFGTERLAETAKSGDKVSLVLKDSGAATNQMMVSAVLKELNSAGIKDEDVTVIIAYDPLRISSAQEGAPLMGEDLSARIRLVRHDCATSGHVHVGRTSYGTDIYLSKTFTEADVKVSASVVDPHPYAGYTGSPEAVLPGISSTETLQQNLALSLNAKAERGILDGNPVLEDMLEAARLAGVDFTLNVVRNSGLDVVRAYAGGLDEAFSEPVRLIDEMYKIQIEGRADVVVMSPGGYPFDADLFEACRGIDGALEATKRGKFIVLVAECLRGCGNKEFHEALSRFKDPKALEKSLRKRLSVGGLMAYRLMNALQSAKMALVSVMPDYYVPEALGVKTARTANEAFDYAFDAAGKNGKVYAIPYGNLTMPQLKTAE